MYADAVAPRTVALIVAVLLLQLGFILSYVGAFHRPTPQRIPVSVVAPTAAAARVVGQLNALPERPVDARAVTSEATARDQLRRGDTSAVFVVAPSGSTDQLLTASAGGTSVSGALQEVFTRTEAAQQRRVQIQDVVPLQAGDARGLTVLVFVVQGNPSAGGAYQGPVLPAFWRVIGPVLPNGAGTTAVRQTVYFDGYGVTGPVLVILTWAVAGAVIALAASVLRSRSPG